MMKKTIALSCIIAASLSSCKTVGSKTPRSEMDSVAYAIGMDFGPHVKNIDSTLSVEYIAAGIHDVLTNNEKMTQEEYMAFLREYFMVRKPLKNKEASEKWLEQIKKDTKNIQETPSGLLYVIEEEGGKKPTSAADTVVVHYRGTLPGGAEFDSSYGRGQTISFPLNGVIPAWTEGMQLVGEGGKIILYAPSDLAYGERGSGQMIEPNTALKFEVELVEVKPVSVVSEEE